MKRHIHPPCNESLPSSRSGNRATGTIGRSGTGTKGSFGRDGHRTVGDGCSGSTPSTCWDSDWIERDGDSVPSVCWDGYRIERDGDWIGITGVRLPLVGLGRNWT